MNPFSTASVFMGSPRTGEYLGLNIGIDKRGERLAEAI
jgi:hypothetical protein